MCVICLGIVAGATEPADSMPDLTGRTMYCLDCGRERPSSLDAPFFEYVPDRQRDRYYCGCRGWD